jgi:hypothetical protein
MIWQKNNLGDNMPKVDDIWRQKQICQGLREK